MNAAVKEDILEVLAPGKIRLDTQAHSFYKSTQTKRIARAQMRFYNSEQETYVETMNVCTCAQV